MKPRRPVAAAPVAGGHRRTRVTTEVNLFVIFARHCMGHSREVGAKPLDAHR